MKKPLIVTMTLFALMRPSGTQGNAPLRVQVTPAVSRAPAQLTVRVTVENAEDNRLLQITAESADYYRSSEVQIEGENSAPLHVFEFSNLPTGMYQVTGVLVGVHGPRATVTGLAKVEPSVGGLR